jgi:deoxyadenosine/deoxycytidine kinase
LDVSTVDDIRKLLQDMISPDLKALETRITALEREMDLRFKEVDGRFKNLEEKMDVRFKHLEEKIDLKFDLVQANMATNQQSILQALDMARRIERLEERDSNKTLDRPS